MRDEGRGEDAETLGTLSSCRAASQGYSLLTLIPHPPSLFPVVVTSLVQPGCPCLTHATDPPPIQIRGDHAASPTTEISSSAALANSPQPPRSRRRAWLHCCPPHHRRRRSRMARPRVPLIRRSRTVLSLRRRRHPLGDSRCRRASRIPRRRTPRRPPAVRGRVIVRIAPGGRHAGAP